MKEEGAAGFKGFYKGVGGILKVTPGIERVLLYPSNTNAAVTAVGEGMFFLI